MASLSFDRFKESALDGIAIVLSACHGEVGPVPVTLPGLLANTSPRVFGKASTLWAAQQGTSELAWNID